MPPKVTVTVLPAFVPLAAENVGVGIPLGTETALHVYVRFAAPASSPAVTLSPVLVFLTVRIPRIILLESFLSFLGLGVQEPTAAWGLMLRGAAVEFAETAPWMGIFPGLAISLAVFAFNLFGDSLRDALDPRLRTQ